MLLCDRGDASLWQRNNNVTMFSFFVTFKQWVWHFSELFSALNYEPLSEHFTVVRPSRQFADNDAFSLVPTSDTGQFNCKLLENSGGTWQWKIREKRKKTMTVMMRKRDALPAATRQRQWQWHGRAKRFPSLFMFGHLKKNFHKI